VTPGRLDPKIVADRLALVRQCLIDLRSLPSATLAEFVADRRNAHAADALLRRSIEGLFDTARHVLAKQFGVGALEYRDVARKAAEHALVVDPVLAERFVQMAGFRNRLTHHYENVTPLELFEIVRSHLPDIEAIAESLRAAAARLDGQDVQR
jgi:uncharacterized protein YutE (UPF0331/DUF86 family)